MESPGLKQWSLFIGVAEALGCWCWNAKAVAEVITDTELLPFEEDECGPGAALTIGDEALSLRA